MTDLAGVFAEQGRYADAVHQLDAAFGVANAIGYQWVAGVIIANAAELCVRQGDYGHALAYCRQALVIAGQLGDRAGVLDSLGRLGAICAAEGRYAEAERLLDRAIALSRKVKDRWFLCESLLDKARVCADCRRSEEAETLAGEALAVSKVAGREDVALPARLLLTRLEVELRRSDTKQAIAKLELLLEECSDETERAAVLYSLWLLDHRDDSRLAAAKAYADLYRSTPNIEFRTRLEALGTEPPPESARIPTFAQDLAMEAVSIDTLIEEADVMGRKRCRCNRPCRVARLAGRG